MIGVAPVRLFKLLPVITTHLAGIAVPAASHEHEDTALEIEWPTFAGAFRVELAAITQFNASIEDVDASELGKYVRNHVERGLSAIQNTRSLSELVTIVLSATN